MIVERAWAEEWKDLLSDCPVKEPVGRGGHGERLGADLEREDLAGDDPGDGSPGAREEEDVDADEGDHGVLSCLIGCAHNGTSDSDDELADSHADGAEEEEVAATPLLNHPETGEGGGDVDGRGDHRNDEGVAEPCVLEELGTVVEDEVDTSKLLERLEQAAGEESPSEITLEAVKVGGLAQRELVLVISGDFGQFFQQSGVLNVESSKLGEGLGSLFGLALLDVPAWSLGQENATDEDNDGPCELHSNRNAVRSTVVALLGCIVNDGGEKKTNGNCKLVAADDGTADPFRAGFRLVERDGSRDHAYTVAREETACDEHGNFGRSSLQDDSEAENDAAGDEAKTSTKKVSDGSSRQSSKECSGRQNGDNLRCLV